MDDDHGLLERLRAGDEDAFQALVERHDGALRRVAGTFVRTSTAADEVVQETWLAVVRGLSAFEGRSSLRTWIFRILTNIAKTRGQREGRSVPFAALAGDDLDAPAWDPGSFLGPFSDRPGAWSSLPHDWSGIPEDRLLSAETRAVVAAAIEGLPPLQAAVIRLHDVAGWSSEEVRNALDLTETNQRVLLHRARAKVRRALDEYLESR